MKRILFTWILTVLTFVQAAFGADAPLLMKGQSESTYTETYRLQTPNRQETVVGTSNVLLETGNDNVLINPSFEATTASTGWTAAGTAVAETTEIVAGKKSLKITLAAYTGDVLVQSYTPTEKWSGLTVEVISYIKTMQPGLQLCLRINSLDVDCVDIAAVSNWSPYLASYPGADGVPHAYVLKAVSSVTGDIYIDKNKLQIGLPQPTIESKKAGELVFDTGGTPPDNAFLCDGRTVSRTQYAELFAKIGTRYGTGDGSTTFHIPDYRGRFLRMTDGSANRDPDKASRTAMNTGGNTGNNVGSVQADQFDSHTHTQNAHTHTVRALNATTQSDNRGLSATGSLSIVGSNSGGGGYVNITTYPGDAGSQVIQNSTATNQNSGGNETRPLNANVDIYIVHTSYNTGSTTNPVQDFSFSSENNANITGINPNSGYVKLGTSNTVATHNPSVSWVNGTFTAKTTGSHSFSSSIYFTTTNVLNSAYYLAIYKNGSFFKILNGSTPAASTNFGISGSISLPLVAGDTIETYLYGVGDNSSSTLTAGSYLFSGGPSSTVAKNVTVPQSVTAPYLGVTTINNVVSKSSNYTATDRDETIIFTADATLTLPSIAGKKYYVINSGSGTETTITPASGTICGSSSIILAGDSDSIEVQFNGTNWDGLSNGCFVTRSTYIEYSSGTPSATNQNPNGWVSSVTDVNTGRFIIVPKSNIFSGLPHCGGITRNSSASLHYASDSGQSWTNNSIPLVVGAPTDVSGSITCHGRR